MNILLIQPPRERLLSDYLEPLCLESIVSELGPDYDIMLCCPNLLPNKSIEDSLTRFRIDIAAITGMGVDEAQIHTICKKIREVSSGTRVVVGGWRATTFPHNLSIRLSISLLSERGN